MSKSERKYVRFTPIIGVGMTHEETIKFVADLFGVSYVKRERKRPRKDVYVLRVTRTEELKTILRALLPWSITKRKQIELLLQFISLKESLPEEVMGRTKRRILPQHVDNYLRLSDIYLKLRKLHAKGGHFDYDTLRKRLQDKIKNMFKNNL